MMKVCRFPLIVGGASGIGLAIAHVLAKLENVERIAIVDKNSVPTELQHPKFEVHNFDLTATDFSFFDRFADIDGLMITAGFGRLSLFKDISEEYIIASMQVNATAAMRIVHRFSARLHAKEDFFCGIMVSIAGFMSSPFFAVYGASKAALKIFIESLNIELEKGGTSNRILNVSPGSIAGTGFASAAPTNLAATTPLAEAIVEQWLAKNDLFIPKYDEVFREVLERYHADFRAEGRHSYEYKIQSGRLSQT